MPVPRSRILRGPCQIQMGGQTFYSKGDVIVNLNMKTTNIVTSAIGLVDYRDDDLDATINFTLDGQVTNALLAVIYPFIQAGIYPGSSVFGATDTTCTIWTRDGYKHVFACTAVTKQPDFSASATKTVFGAMTISAIRANNTPWSGTNSLVAVTQVNYPGDAAYNLGNIITQPYAARWFTGTVPTGSVSGSGASPDVFTTEAVHGLVVGDTIMQSGFADASLNGCFTVATVPTTEEYTLYLRGTTTPVNGSGGAEAGGTFVRANAWDSFSTEAGFTISTNVTLHDEMTDDIGLIDKTFQQIEVTCKFVPVGPLPSDVIAALAIQGAGAARGHSRAATGQNLYLTGTGLFAKMTQAAMISSAPIRAGMAVKRVGEVTFKSTMTLADNAPVPPLALSTNSIA